MIDVDLQFLNKHFLRHLCTHLHGITSVNNNGQFINVNTNGLCLNSIKNGKDAGIVFNIIIKCLMTTLSRSRYEKNCCYIIGIWYQLAVLLGCDHIYDVCMPIICASLNGLMKA